MSQIFKKDSVESKIIGLGETALIIILFVIALFVVYNYVVNSAPGIYGYVEVFLVVAIILEQVCCVALLGYNAYLESGKDTDLMKNYVVPLGLFIGSAVLGGILVLVCEHLLIWTTSNPIVGDMLAMSNLVPIVYRLIGWAFVIILMAAYGYYYNEYFLKNV